MTDRHDENDQRQPESTDGDVPKPDSDGAESESAERRALADAIRDALATRAATGEQSFPPLRSRPVMPRALDTRSVSTEDGSAPDAEKVASSDADAPVPGATDARVSDDTDVRPPASADASERQAAGSWDEMQEVSAESPASATWAGIAPIPEHDQEPLPTHEQEHEHEPVPENEHEREREREREHEPEQEQEQEQTDAVPVEAEDDPDEPSSLEAPVRIDEPRNARRRFTGRGAIVVGARALAGIVGIGVAVVAIAGATALPLPRYVSVPPEVTVRPIAAAQQRVCPGPLLRLGNDEGQEATSATSVGRATAQYQAAPRDAEADDLAQTENTAGVAPLLLTLPPGSESDDGVAAVAGSQSQLVRSGDLVGFASAECAEAGGDIWLVGGSTDVGRTTLITLSNPTTVIATVRMRVFGSAGEVVAPGLDGIVVPPGSQRIFSLAGFAPQLVAPVINVESRGGLVVADLQQTTVRTLEPGGVDLVGPTHAPARNLTIPGVLISGASAISAAQGRPEYGDLQATLRIFSPGTDTTIATVTITPERGTTPPPRSDSVAVEGATPGATTDSGGFEVALVGGEVTEIPFPGLTDGDYTVSLESAVPLVAGVRISTVSDDGETDFAWLPAGAPLRDTALVSVASGPSPVLRLSNPTDTEQTVTITTADGDVDVELAAGESVPTRLRAGRDATLTGAAGMIATVTYSGPGQLSSFGLTSPRPASGDITVYR